jgi:hypothetical protein
MRCAGRAIELLRLLCVDEFLNVRPEPVCCQSSAADCDSSDFSLWDILKTKKRLRRADRRCKPGESSELFEPRTHVKQKTGTENGQLPFLLGTFLQLATYPCEVMTQGLFESVD